MKKAFKKVKKNVKYCLSSGGSKSALPAQNQNFGSIQARAIILIFISNFQNSIIFNSGWITAAYKTVVFCKIVTLLRKWRHCSVSLKKYSKLKPYYERQSPYLDCVFYFKSISCLVSAWEHTKKDIFLQCFQTPPNVL